MDETVKSLHTPDGQQEAIALLSKIAANLPGIIFQFLQQQDGSQFLLDVSSGCRELYELEPEVIRADFWVLHRLIHPQDMDTLATSVAVAVANLSTWRWEGRIITPSGKLKWIQGVSQLERQANGDLLWQGLIIDITDRKQAEVIQQSLAQKFSKAFRCSPNAITISTLHEGRYVEVNDSFVRLSGYQRDEAIGYTAFELNTWVNRRDRLKLLKELQERGFVRNLEVEFRTKSGVIMTALLSAEIIDLDGVSCILAITNDITARKQVEAQLRLSAERDRLLTKTLARIRSSLNLDHILQTTVSEVRQFLQADRVFIGLNDGKVGATSVAESVNPDYPSVLGWRINDEAYLQELKRLLTSDRIRLVEDVSQIAVSPKLQAHYQQFHTRATLAVPIMLGDELFGALVANQCSGPRRWQTIEIDLLQQMSEQLAIAIQQSFIYQELAELNTNLEQQVEERTAQLQQKMQELSELQRIKDVVLHTVAHDLRTAVMGNLMVLKNLLPDSKGFPLFPLSPEGAPSLPAPCTPIPVSQAIIERMIQGNDRQLGMIDSLLEMHGCEGKGIVLQCEMVSLSILLQSALQDLQPILNQNQALLKNLISQDLPLVLVDSAKLHRVLVSLFTHRLQHNPPGLNFTFKATVAKEMIRIQMQDDGVAMTKLECDRLFNLYIPNPQGPCLTEVALKMYLVRQIIQAHGGEIGVISHRQRGLTFWFTLPLATSS